MNERRRGFNFRAATVRGLFPQSSLLRKRPLKWGLRNSFLRTLVLLGTATALTTEILSAFHLLRRGPLVVAWLLVMALLCRRPRFALPRWRWFEATAIAVILAIAAITGFTAVLSPPNSADAMAYHMPRVIYWAQAGAVSFFPTPYFNQIMLQPLAEYAMLHSYLITGGDHLVNLVAWGAFLGCIVGVSSIAAAMGAGTRGQAFAALVCATLPNAILQASGAKNDLLVALWLVCIVYFALRRDAAFTGLSLGLALSTKATAYLFAPPLLIACLLAAPKAFWRSIAASAVGGILLINTPQYVRNMRLSGSPLGYDSAQGDGFFRWRNEHPGWKSTASNALRNISEQLGARSASWNQRVYDAVIRTHYALGLDPQDPATTWPWARYEPPLNANHEANANNRWHLLLLVLLAIGAATKHRWNWAIYAAALVAAFLLFCFYLKWQPFLARLELPLFIVAAPLAALVFDLPGRAATVFATVIAAFLVSNARLPLIANWTRPLKGPNSLLVTHRDDNYFNDMSQWNNRPSYVEAVERVAQSGCGLVGIDISRNQLEYPFQALLRERNPGVRFVHPGVDNPSERYYPRDPPQPCAVLCPDCGGVESKLRAYRNFGPPITIGRFLLLLKQRTGGDL